MECFDSRLLWMRDTLVKEGIESIRFDEKDSFARENGIRGFEMCRSLNSIEEFKQRLDEMLAVADREGKGFWKVRHARVQVKYVYGVLLCGCGGDSGPEAAGRYEELALRFS